MGSKIAHPVFGELGFHGVAIHRRGARVFARDHGDFAFGLRRALGRRLADADYDAAYVLPNSWKSALAPFFAGIPRRIGYLGEARYLLLSEPHRLDAARHPQLAQRYAALAGDPPPWLARIIGRTPALSAGDSLQTESGESP